MITADHWSRTGATILSVAFVLILPLPGNAEEQPETEAERHFQSGERHFREGLYSAAIGEFETAERLNHSRWNLFNLALCHERLGQVDQALFYIDSYLSEPDLSEEDQDRGARVRQRLQDSRPPEPPLPPDEPLPEEEDNPEEPVEPAPSSSSSARTWSIMLGVLGGAVLTSSIVCYGVAWSRYSSRPEQFDDWSLYIDWRDTSEDTALAGDILIGAGGLMVGVAIVLAVIHHQRSARASETDH